MAHAVIFENFSLLRGLLSSQEAQDIIDVLYQWDDASFVIQVLDVVKGKKIRGDYSLRDGAHWIRLIRSEIIDSFEKKLRCGGNYAAPSKKMAVAMVLAHELQHANQRMNPSPIRAANHRQYNRRGIEKDARASVDNNMRVIAEIVGEHVPSVFGAPAPAGHGDHDTEISDVAELFEDLSEVSVRDIVEELRSSGINNSLNVARVREILQQKGVKVAA